MHKTLKPGGTFVVEPRRLSKASAELRARGFGEITLPPSTETAEKQASRCTDCGVPFCQNACPLQNNIPDWLRLSAENEAREAWRVSSQTSTMPEICGRICPQDRLCEGSCTLNQSGWDAVTIGSVEAWLGDQAWEKGWVEPIRPAAERGESIETALKWMKQVSDETELFFTIDTLEYLRRGGRIGRVQATLGGLLNLKPVIHVDKTTGTYENVGRARSYRAAIEAVGAAAAGR